MRADLDQIATLREQVLFSLVLLVIVVLFFRIFYSGQARRLAMQKGRIESLQMEKDALIKFSAATPAVARGGQLSRKKGMKVKILNGEVKTTTGEISGLLAQLTVPSFLEGIAVEKLSHKPPVRGAGYAGTDFTLNVRGGFGEMMQYLERLEQFPALFDVEQISLTVAEGQPQDVTAEIQCRFFELGGAGAAGPPETAPAKTPKPGGKK